MAIKREENGSPGDSAMKSFASRPSSGCWSVTKSLGKDGVLAPLLKDLLNADLSGGMQPLWRTTPRRAEPA